MFIELQDGTLYNVTNCRKITFNEISKMDYELEFYFDDNTTLILNYYSEESLLKARENLRKFIKEDRKVVWYGELLNA